MIEYSLINGSQSFVGEAIDMDHVPRLRARIKRDSYDTQSHAVVESWTDSGWKEISRRPIGDQGIVTYASRRAREEWEPAMRAALGSLLLIGRRFFSGEPSGTISSEFKPNG